MSESLSSLDAEPYFSAIKDAIERGETNASIARANGVSEKSIRRFRKRHEINPVALAPGGAYTKIDLEKGEAEGQSERLTTKPILDDPDTMLSDRGLDPEEWTITHITPNEYQGPSPKAHYEATGQAKVTYYQTKFTAQRKRPDLQIIAARSDGWVAPSRNRRNISGGEGKLVAFMGDQQAPFHDENLHRLACQWLEVNKPDEGVLIGDTVDYPDISRHRKTPAVMRTLRECNQAGYGLLRGYRESSLDTEWTKLVGNHDWRLHLFIIDHAPALHSLARAATDEDPEPQPILSVDYLLRLDELGINYIDPPFENWELGQHNVSQHLAARHGWIARSGSGKTALQTLEHLGYSVIVGHTHRQSKVYKTTYDINDYPTTLTAVETGCMCRLDLGYAVKPDWQQGFATATIYEDGKFNIDLATYVNGVLMWRDQRYE